MSGAEQYVLEMEEKNVASFQRLLAVWAKLVEEENFSPTDILRLEMRATVEATEVAALWLSAAESIEEKIVLGARCGDTARHYTELRERLAATGFDVATFDARYGGYSKLFAFFRSLQTAEERAASGAVTLRAFDLDRLRLFAKRCDDLGDAASAALLRGSLAQDAETHREAGRQILVANAKNEESQARARRSAYRTIELLGELSESSLLRKFLNRSISRR